MLHLFQGPFGEPAAEILLQQHQDSNAGGGDQAEGLLRSSTLRSPWNPAHLQPGELGGKSISRECPQLFPVQMQRIGDGNQQVPERADKFPGKAPSSKGKFRQYPEDGG